MKTFLSILTPNASGGYMPVGTDEIGVTMERRGVGRYRFSSDAFTQGQTFAFAAQAREEFKNVIRFDEEGVVDLSVYNSLGKLADGGENIAIAIYVTQ